MDTANDSPPKSIRNLLVLLPILSLSLSVVALTSTQSIVSHAFSRGRRDNEFGYARKSSCFATQVRNREAKFSQYSQPRVSHRSLDLLNESFHNYTIDSIDGTQGGAASTNPRLKRGKVTRWNAWFRKERPPVKRFGCVSVCSIACFRLSNFLLLFLDPPISTG